LVEIENMVLKYGTGALLPIDFSDKDINIFLEQVKNEDIASWKENCFKFSKESNWQSYEKSFMDVYK